LNSCLSSPTDRRTGDWVFYCFDLPFSPPRGQLFLLFAVPEDSLPGRGHPLTLLKRMSSVALVLSNLFGRFSSVLTPPGSLLSDSQCFSGYYIHVFRVYSGRPLLSFCGLPATCGCRYFYAVFRPNIFFCHPHKISTPLISLDNVLSFGSPS